MEKEKEFNELLIRHKKLCIKLANKLDEEEVNEKFWLFKRLSSQARELAIVSSGFKCERCKTKDNLTIHHLIMKKAKEFMPDDRYFSQRMYWANRLCLCVTCHDLYHNVVDKTKNPEDDVKRLNEKYLNKLKEKWKQKIK